MENISIKNILNFIMALFYISLGAFLLLKENIYNFSSIQKYGVGIILLGYGIFRLYRSIIKSKEEAYHEDEE